MDVVFSAVSAETNGTGTYDMVVSLEDGTKITRRLPGFRNEDVVMFHNGAPAETLLAPRGKLLFDTDGANMYVCAEITDTKVKWVPTRVPDVPEHTAGDEGKILTIKDGQKTWEEIGTKMKSVMHEISDEAFDELWKSVFGEA